MTEKTEGLKLILSDKKKLIISAKITTQCAKCEIRGILADGTLKITLHSPPEKGKANSELITLLSSIFNIPKNNISILRGKTGALKKILLIKSDNQ